MREWAGSEVCVNARRVGITVVAFAFAISGGASGQLPRLEHAFTIGCSACAGPASFYEVAGIVLRSDGRVIVLDHAEPHVRVFGSDGAVVRAFGRQGSGPGEFRTPSFLLPAPGDAIDVIDIAARRMTRVDVNGRELSTSPLRDFPVAAGRAAARSDFLLATTDFRKPTLAIEKWGASGASETMLRFSADFPLRDENQPSMFVSLAVAPDGSFAVGDGGFEYRIRIYDAEGHPKRDITRTVERLRRTPAEMAAERNRLDRALARGRAMRAAEGRGSSSMPARDVAELKAHFLAGAFAFDDNGRLWVRTERGGLEDTRFDLFDPGGRYVGEIRVERRIGRFVIAHGILAGVTRDTDETQYVTVFRLVE